MRAAGVRPDTRVFTTLMDRLMDEGEVGEAKRVLEAELAITGVELPKHTLDKYRLRILQCLLESGSLMEAHAVMKTLVESSEANVNHFNAIMKSYRSSRDMQRLISNDMPIASVQPNAFTFTILIDQLVVEGDMVGAKHTLDNQLTEAGSKPRNKLADSSRKQNPSS